MCVRRVHPNSIPDQGQPAEFRGTAKEAERVQAWAELLGVDRSELLCDALRCNLLRLAGENDALIWVEQPLTDGERAIAAIADWGPAEDWSDWADAASTDLAISRQACRSLSRARSGDRLLTDRGTAGRG
jgi:hypothetical protein